MMGQAIPKTTQSSKNNYLTLTTNDHLEGFQITFSTNKNYWKKPYYTKHFQIPNLSKQEASYLKDLLEQCPDFRQAIALAKEEIKTYRENP